MTPTSARASAECQRLAKTHLPKPTKWERPLSPKARAILAAINDGRDPDALTAGPGEQGGATKIFDVLRRRKYITAKRAITYAGKMILLYWETRRAK